jgi:hypothetical protein
MAADRLVRSAAVGDLHATSRSAGTEHGTTTAGVPVRNVARQVLHAPYGLYTIASRSRGRMVTDLHVVPETLSPHEG